MTERARRSLKASPAGISRANKALLIFGTTFDLATELEISCVTVQNFFAGKPVGRENFQKICQKLKLSWQDIASLPKDTAPEPQEDVAHNSCDLEVLVQKVRQKGRKSIQQRCGTMQVLDMCQPLKLNDIYTNVNIVEINGRRRLEVADLLLGCVSDEFERPGLGRIATSRVLGLEAIKKYSKLIVLGKPGAGKTTFLKHVAIQCSLGKFQANLVPIFITLKDFAETEQCPSLLEYITCQFNTYGFTDTTVAKQILSQGHALVLLDGLDEVRETDRYQVVQEIRNFSAKFHVNHFVITCRIATGEYTFEHFTEVEVADFDSEQITNFATKWFACIDPNRANRFIQKLNQNRPIQELASNPLLLTLLCLVFEESVDFPSNRSELYKEGLNVLLNKWDAKRNISREQVYKKLSVQHKEDLLGQIALKTFERGDYFFRQTEIEQHIADYIRNLPSVSTDVEALQLDSEAVLKSIEAQHGLLVERAHLIYSFSHLTLQEYFTAREIVASSEPQALEKALKNLVSRITEKRWREVFLLTVEMLRNGDYLLQLMTQQIDPLVAGDEQLQAFLTWVSQKSSTANVSYKSVAVRIFYLALESILTLVGNQMTLDRALALAGGILEIAFTLDHSMALNRTLEIDLALYSALDLALDRALALALARALTLNRALGLDLTPSLELDLALALELDLTRALDLALDRTLNPKLEQSLKRLEAQLPDPEVSREKFKQWWKAKGGAWTEKLRSVMTSHRNIGHSWQFSEQQRSALSQYYDANSLLVYCLNSDCYMTRTVREEIEETLFLPFVEIQQRKGAALK